jgi:hypothetical protein
MSSVDNEETKRIALEAKRASDVETEVTVAEAKVFRTATGSSRARGRLLHPHNKRHAHAIGEYYLYGRRK